MTNIEEQTSYCLSCPRPRCETGCPTRNHIRDFIHCLKENDLSKAAEVLYAVNPFPELTSRLCDCDRQCQGHCVRGIKGDPVEIRQIERYIADHSSHPQLDQTVNGKKAALVGSGPSCLAAARDLYQGGWEVHIYEKEEKIGGAILTGIPAYRFDHSYLDTIVQELQEAGIVFHFGCTVGKDITLKDLQQDYDAVLLGIGAQVERKYGMEGIHATAGLSLLYDLNVLHKDYTHFHRAIVWGGGNVAMDCARSLKRVLDEVIVVYRRSEKEMPANRDEIEEAKAEGVVFRFLSNVKSLVLDEEGKVKAARCIRMELGEADASGRAAPHEVEGSEEELPADLFVAAIGQSVDLSLLDPLLAKGETHHSSLPKVYLCGDAYLGPKTVAAAITDGRLAAAEILAGE